MHQGWLVRLAGAAVIASFAAGAAPAQEAVRFPTTPAGHRAAAWLAAFNSGDTSQVRRFYQTALDPISARATPIGERVANYPELRRRLGTIEPRTAHSGSATAATVNGVSAAGPVSLTFTVAPAPPHLLQEVRIELGHAPASAGRADAAPIADAGPVGDSPATVAPRETKIDGPVELPMFFDAGGRPLMEIAIEGAAPTRAVLDLGSNAMLVSPALVERMRLPTDTLDTRIYARIDSLRLGAVTLRGIAARVLDNGTGADAVLGINAFAEVLLTLDYPVAKFRLERGALDPASHAVVPYDTVPDGWIMVVPLTAGRDTLPVILDSGSPGFLLLPAALAERVDLVAPTVAGHVIQGPMVRRERTQVGRASADWRLGSLVLERPTVSIVSTHVNGSGNLGQRLLRQLVVTIDQRQRLVRLARPGGARVTSPPMTAPGFHLHHGGPTWIVGDVIPGSKAAAAGLQQGDTVVSAAGRRPEEFSPTDFAGWLEGATFDLEVRRGRPLRVRFDRTVLVP